MQKRQVVIAVSLLLIIAAVFWMAVPVDSGDPGQSRSGVEERSASGRGAQMAAGSRGSGAGFMVSHARESGVVPSADNVDATFHTQRELLARQVEVSPDDTTAIIRLARLLHDGHQLEEAAEYYRRYLDQVPVGRQARLDLTRCLGDLQKWDDALALSMESLELMPDDPGIWFNLGAIYANTSRFGEARGAFEKVAAQTEDETLKARADEALRRLAALAE